MSAERVCWLVARIRNTGQPLELSRDGAHEARNVHSDSSHTRLSPAIQLAGLVVGVEGKCRLCDTLEKSDHTAEDVTARLWKVSKSALRFGETAVVAVDCAEARQIEIEMSGRRRVAGG